MWGLFLTILFASICGCSSDEIVNSGSQVTYAEVKVGFFQKSMTALSKTTTRASETEQANLKKNFKRLDIAFIPKEKVAGLAKDTIYTFAQTVSGDNNFGKLSVKLPVGKYTMVAIASRADKAVTINDKAIVSFPNNKVTDMAYAYQDLELGKDGASIDGTMKRAVAKFFLKATDVKGANMTSMQVSCKGKCNNSFDPQKGVGVDGGDFTYSVNYDISAISPVKPTLTFYVLPVETSSKFTINITLYDKDSNTLKALEFKDVSLAQNYVTTYTGKLFSTEADGTFGMVSADYEDGGTTEF